MQSIVYLVIALKAEVMGVFAIVDSVTMVDCHAENETKLLQYADDTTAVLSDINSAQTLFRLLDDFEKISGLAVKKKKKKIGPMPALNPLYPSSDFDNSHKPRNPALL